MSVERYTNIEKYCMYCNINREFHKLSNILLTEFYKDRGMKEIIKFFRKYQQQKVNINKKEHVIQNTEIILNIYLPSAILTFEFNKYEKCINTILLQK